MHKFITDILNQIQKSKYYKGFEELITDKKEDLSFFEDYKNALFETEVYLKRINEKLGCEAKKLDVFDILCSFLSDIEARLYHEDSEKTLSVCVGSESYSAEENCSGDSFDHFTVNDKFYAILCDGMGVGKPAYVSATVFSTLLSRFLRSGFSVDLSLSLAICFYKTLDLDEAFTTLDLFWLDLSTGEGRIIKFGACDSYIFSDDSHYVPSGGYPIGILNESDFSTYSFNFKDGDYLIMMSDGAQSLPQIVISNCIKNSKSGDIGLVCKEILAHCHKKDDDITVCGICFNKI